MEEISLQLFGKGKEIKRCVDNKKHGEENNLVARMPSQVACSTGALPQSEQLCSSFLQGLYFDTQYSVWTQVPCAKHKFSTGARRE